MKLKLNTAVASSDPLKYDPVLTAYNYRVKQPVKNGAVYLDRTQPGWARRVDLVTFNMRYTSSDVLAQIYGTDGRATPEYRDWSYESLCAHGFYASGNQTAGYDELTIAWREAIQARTGQV